MRLGIARPDERQSARHFRLKPVAAVVARGDIELGFQQVSELLPVKGGPISSAKLPAEVQKITVFLGWHPKRRRSTRPKAGALIALPAIAGRPRGHHQNAVCKPIAPAP